MSKVKCEKFIIGPTACVKRTITNDNKYSKIKIVEMFNLTPKALCYDAVSNGVNIVHIRVDINPEIFKELVLELERLNSENAYWYLQSKLKELYSRS